mgnify:FL=1
MLSNEQMIKALEDFDISNICKPRKTFTERLAMLALKGALYGYLILTVFAIGMFTTIYSDGILFEIDGIVSYWIDFGGELTNDI